MTIKSKDWLKKRKSVFNSIFPREYDFEEMLYIQAQKTLSGVECFIKWLKKSPQEKPSNLEKIALEVDSMRYDMEEKLINAFSTPFDRQDIYSLSRNMDYILNYSTETAKEIYAFGVVPDEYILKMADALFKGTKCMEEGVRIIRTDKNDVERKIREARSHMHAIEDFYITGMSETFNNSDAIYAMKKREVNYHIRDAGWALRKTVDVMHKAVVGLN
ncbi:uncharacterized protein Yka (UPF0111/DUF47 family) [Methanomicrobium sp. W14]|uniref:DUF47 domain-containing protein n=1 Tax=Methanomicrobium sp. W14 TaxID=2817839 RepID=UPI001AE1750A|nr:DUF47 family protein [Methanomicrobium sp. W14]MBP2132956.1 uncharacterized protein Yka (UPF0111/DUF47 family) [Methanomicrobium sp. W14]